MSPRDLDAGIVLARLTSIRELLHDLRLAGEVSKADLQRDRMLRHAVERILAQLVELAVSVNSHVAATAWGKAPGDYRESFELLQAADILPPELTVRLRQSVGLRNVLAHEYARVDLNLVAGAVIAAERDYGGYVEHVSRWLQSRV